MSKTLPALLCLALLMSACESEAPVVVEEDEPTTEEVVVEDAEIIEEVTFESSRETTVATGSSELEDDTGYGFAYNASNVLDLDYSTSWCPTDEGVPQVLSLSFPEVTALGSVGIVGGYARDEKIFFQNNRLKTLEVWYDDLPEAVDELHFEDVYGMQFFDLTQEEAQTVKFKIMETYPGSKYTDTCVAEVDLWSEYVTEQNAEAAYDYYLENKEAYSLRPVGIKNLAMSFGAEGADDNSAHLVAKTLNSCGQINRAVFESELIGNDTEYSWADTGEWAYIHNSFEGEGGSFWGEGEWMSWAGNVPAVSVEMNEWAKEGDLVTIKWIDYYLTDIETGEINSRLIDSEEFPVKLCTDGSLHVSSILSANEGEYSFWGSGGVEVYFNDRLLGQTDYSLPQ